VSRSAIAGAIVLMCSFVHSMTAAANAQVEVTLDALPTRLRVGETFQLQVKASVKGGSLEDLTLEDLRKYPELEMISHQTSRPMQISFGFGSGMNVQSSLSHQYSMRALAPGTYEFSPAVARVDGKTYRSDPLTIVVLPSDGTEGAEPPPAPDIGEDLSGAKYDPRAFLRTVVEPAEVYVGQQVDVTVYLYTRLGVSGRSVTPTKPSMDGFWVYDEQLSELEGSVSTINGMRYRAYVIQSSAAFPQRAGELTIGPPKVAFDTGSMSFFDSGERVERTGVPVTVTVKPLPKPGPDGAFVGKYAIRGWLDRPTVQTGNAVTLRIDATGVGNIQDLRIALPEVPGIRVLKPAIKDKRRFYGEALGGTRSWEWIMIPELPGEYTIPEIVLDYFDPETETYGSTRTKRLTFTATGAAVRKPPTVGPVAEPEKSEAPKFGPLRMYSALTRDATPIRERSWFAPLLALPPLGFVLLVGVVALRRRRERGRTSESARQRRLLREAGDALRGDDPRAFYDRVVAAILHALDTCVDEPVKGLSNAELRARLKATGFDDDLVRRVINELEGADFARFAASGVDSAEMERCLERTEAIIERIRRQRSNS